jgi:predicted metal-dependent HD superfamily phosphohydrolase
VDVEMSGSAHDHLLGGWVRHLSRLAPLAGRDRLMPVGRDLLERYGEPHRAYHDRRHLAEVLAGVALLAEHADDLSVAVAAAWWHDAVYTVPVLTSAGTPTSETSASTGDGISNEEASAQLAERTLSQLGADAERAAHVGMLVRMTATHDPSPLDPDAEVLSDADLSVLASPPNRYATYVADVRREYAAVPDDLFRTGRAAILRNLLEGERVFRTPSAHERWEADARANIAAELRELDA